MTQLRELTASLRHRDFRLLWSSQTLSVIGDQIITVAMALFIIDLTGSATDLGIVLAAHSLPLVAFVLVGGIWADRLPRHRVVVVTDLIRFALQAVLALLIFTDAVQVWHLVVISVLFGTAEAFYRPAVTALLPQTVPEAEIQEANALTSMSNNLGEFVGPALATLLVLGAGAGTAFALDAATFLVSAAVVIRLHPRRRAAGAGDEQRRPRAGARSCAPALRRSARAPGSGRRCLRSASPCSSGSRPGTCSAAGRDRAVRRPRRLRGGRGHVRRRDDRRLADRDPVAPAAPDADGDGVRLPAAGLADRLRGRRQQPPRLPAVLIGGIGLALFDVWWLTALAERIPPDRLSRVSSYDWLVSLGLVPLGYLLAGPLAAEFGAVTIMIAGSAIALVAMLAALLPRETRMLERLDADEHLEALAEPRPGLPT